jgi:ubiquinone/menaquinone biosynthesis C-methylase UbiE
MTKKSGWQLSGDGPDAYEKYIVPAYTGAWAKEIVNRACLSEGEKILDVACGTGLVARIASEKQSSTDLIYGLDVNEVMVKKAQEIEENIKWHHSDVTDMPFPNNHFDVIFCQQGLQYFPDPALALKEMNRVLAGNGRILLSVWRPIEYSPFYASLYKVLEKYISIKAASTLSGAFNFGDLRKLKTLFANAGFNNININIVIKQMSYSPFDEFVVGGMMATPFFKDIQEMNESKREKMLLEIYKSNQDYIDDNGLAAPLESYIVNAEN